MQKRWAQFLGLFSFLLFIAGCGTTKIVGGRKTETVYIDREKLEDGAEVEYKRLYVSELMNVPNTTGYDPQGGAVFSWGNIRRGTLDIEMSAPSYVLFDRSDTDYMGNGALVDESLFNDGDLYYSGNAPSLGHIWFDVDENHYVSYVYEGNADTYMTYLYPRNTLPSDYTEGQMSDAYVYGPFIPFQNNLKEKGYLIPQGAIVTINYYADNALFARIAGSYGGEFIYSEDSTVYRADTPFDSWGDYGYLGDQWLWDWQQNGEEPAGVSKENIDAQARFTKVITMDDDVTINISVAC